MKQKIVNPIVPGYYADPEARFYEGRYWIYVTRSYTDYKDQMNIDAFSSTDLIHWEKHEGIIDMSEFPHIWRAVWAPTIVEHNGRYYLCFASNDIQADGESGGLEIAVSERPEGPFSAYLSAPLISRFINKAQPIDAHFFKDDDGTIYLYYGGWSHCNVARMNDSMTGFIPFDDGENFHEITPPGYVEGPCMLKANGRYFFMWSCGNWTDGSYHVSYCCSDSPTKGFDHGTVILSAQDIADGPGHHSYLYIPERDRFMIVYHRRIVGDRVAGHRVLCIDNMYIHGETIDNITMTNSFIAG